jgi:hypothetical protein
MSVASALDGFMTNGCAPLKEEADCGVRLNKQKSVFGW